LTDVAAPVSGYHDVPIKPKEEVQAQAAPKVVVCIPIQEKTDVRWADRLYTRVLPQAPVGSPYLFENRYGIGQTRQFLIDKALSIQGMTHVFFIDSDVIPMTEYVIPTLLQDDKPIVSGVYFNSLFTGLAAWIGEVPLSHQQQNHLIEVDKTGMGLCLIKREVFDKLGADKVPRPWFDWKVFGPNQAISEDFYFFAMLKEKYNIRPWVDMRVQGGHIKSMIIKPDGGATNGV